MKILILLVLIPTVIAWGPIGHNATARLAYLNMNNNTRDYLNTNFNITNIDHFEYISNWADRVKDLPNYVWSYNLHFVDINVKPLTRCNFIYEQDCPNDRCVVGAMRNYSNILSKNNDIDALKFLVHFIGDSFQPFHVGYSQDRGGNDISVSFNNIRSNLHAVWDSILIEERVNSVGSYENWIEILNQRQLNTTIADDFSEYANTSVGTICSDGLYIDDNKPIEDDHIISMDYYKRHIDKLEDRIFMAGYFINKHLEELSTKHKV
jgi:hypothetical protein